MNFILYLIEARERNDYHPSADILSASCSDLYRFVLTKGDQIFFKLKKKIGPEKKPDMNIWARFIVREINFHLNP